MVLVKVIESSARSGLVVNEYDLIVEDAAYAQIRHGFTSDLMTPPGSHRHEDNNEIIEVTMVQSDRAVEIIWEGDPEPPITLEPFTFVSQGNATGH